MAKIMKYAEFLEALKEKEIADQKIRIQELSNTRESNYIERYAIKISFTLLKDDELLLEHETYKKFDKTSNRYRYDSQSTNPPVEAHYHVYPPNSKNELYAVNVSGKAHHKNNRGYKVPAKEAKELRALGVNIPEDNILESIETISDENRYLLLESENSADNYAIVIMIE